MVNKNQIKNLSLFLCLFFYCLDAYSFFNVPFSWIGLIGIFLIAVISDYRILLNTNFYIVIFILLVPSIANSILMQSFDNNLNFLLRSFNVVSFLVVLIFSLKFFNISENIEFMNILQKLILALSIFAIYSYFAQIYDLPEFLRNRSNTGLLGDASQTTFWKNEPHRMVGTFREPVLLVSTVIPLLYLYLFSTKKMHLFTVLTTSLVIGLTRSDLVRVYFFITFIVLFLSSLKRKRINKVIYPVILVLIFSLIGIRECDLNPKSSDCISSDTVPSVLEPLVFSDVENTLQIGNDRNAVVEYAIYSFTRFSPQGITSVNQGFGLFLSEEISNEMYFTNRTLPKHLLTRYEAKNFGTGNYSLLSYYPNVQNLFVNASLSFGASFIAFLFLVLLHIFTSSKKNLELYLFLLFALFFFLTPIEEFNAFTALVIGAGYNMITSNKKDSS